MGSVNFTNVELEPILITLHMWIINIWTLYSGLTNGVKFPQGALCPAERWTQLTLQWAFLFKQLEYPTCYDSSCKIFKCAFRDQPLLELPLSRRVLEEFSRNNLSICVCALLPCQNACQTSGWILWEFSFTYVVYCLPCWTVPPGETISISPFRNFPKWFQMYLVSMRACRVTFGLLKTTLAGWLNSVNGCGAHQGSLHLTTEPFLPMITWQLIAWVYREHLVLNKMSLASLIKNFHARLYPATGEILRLKYSPLGIFPPLGGRQFPNTEEPFFPHPLGEGQMLSNCKCQAILELGKGWRKSISIHLFQ